MEGVQVEGALQWTMGGVHRAALRVRQQHATRTEGRISQVEDFSVASTRRRKAKLLKDADSNLGGEHIREGLSAVIAVWVPQPEFEG